MNTESMKQFGIQTLKNTGALMATNMLGIPQMIKSALPNNKIGGYLATGATYGVALDLGGIVYGTGSNLLNGEFWEFLDRAGFLTVYSGALDASNLDKTVGDFAMSFSPLNQDMTINLVEGALVSGGLTLANFLDQATGTNPIFDAIRRPISTAIKYTQ